MGSVSTHRQHARWGHAAGNVSRDAQRRVDERVRHIMARRDAAQQRDSRSAQPSDGRRGRLEPKAAH